MPTYHQVETGLFSERAPNGRRLLVLGCSATKRSEAWPLPAIDRYMGVNYVTLRRWQRNYPVEAGQLDVYILSAEFGLIPSGQLIPDYDRCMTPARAAELGEQARATLGDVLAATEYTDCYLVAGAVYRSVFLPSFSSSLATPAIGSGIGQQLGALKRWLES